MIYLYAILFLTVIADASLTWSLFGLNWPVMTSLSFLIFVFFRRELWESLLLLGLFAIMAHATSGLALEKIILPYLLILIGILFLKKRLLLETYLMFAVWAALLTFVFVTFQWFLYDSHFLGAFSNTQIFRILGFSILQGGMSFFLFLYLDKIFDRIWTPKKDLYS